MLSISNALMSSKDKDSQSLYMFQIKVDVVNYLIFYALPWGPSNGPCSFSILGIIKCMQSNVEWKFSAIFQGVLSFKFLTGICPRKRV